MFGAKSFLKCLALIVVALFVLWQAVESRSRNLRLDANPHAHATVGRTWTSSGKHASRYADLSFPGPIGIGLCHASGVRLGSNYVAARPGQTIDIVPIPGACASPDIPTARESGVYIMFEFGAAFVVFMFGVLGLAGIAPSARAPLGMARQFG